MDSNIKDIDKGKNDITIEPIGTDRHVVILENKTLNLKLNHMQVVNMAPSSLGNFTF